MNIHSYTSFFKDYKTRQNKIIKNAISINLSQDHYNHKKNNSVNYLLDFIHNRKIFNPPNNCNNSKNFSNNKKQASTTPCSKSKIPKSNSFSILSIKPCNNNNYYPLDRNYSFNHKGDEKLKKYTYNNYKTLFKCNDKGSKSKYNPNNNKQEEIMKTIIAIKNSCLENNKNSFFDEDYICKNYKNIMRFHFVWNKPNKDKLCYLQEMLRNYKNY